MMNMKVKRLEEDRNNKQVVLNVVCVKTGQQFDIQLLFNEVYKVTKIKPLLIKNLIQRGRLLEGYKPVELDALLMRGEELYFAEFRDWELA